MRLLIDAMTWPVCPIGHSSGIFLEGHIAAIVQSGFDAPVRTANFQETSRSSVRAGQAGDP